MGMRLYPLPGGMGMKQKFDSRWIWVGMGMNFFYGDGVWDGFGLWFRLKEIPTSH